MTRRQKDCLAAIKRLTKGGVPPTYEQLRIELGLASKSPVHRLVHALRDRGLITFADNRKNSIALADHKAESVPFDAMAQAVCDHVSAGGVMNTFAIRHALTRAFAGHV